MNIIRCLYCPAIIQTEEKVSPDATFVCRNHTAVEQDIHFQNHQFDRELGGSAPIGTAHISGRKYGVQLSNRDSEDLLEGEENVPDR